MRNATDLTNLRYSSRILASIFWHLRESLVRPGVDADTFNTFVDKFSKYYGGTPSFMGYKGYAYNLNFSIDNQVTHAFPSLGRIVPETGLLKIDIGVIYKGMYSDKCETFVIGKVDEQAKLLSEVCKQAMSAGITAIKAGARLGDIGAPVDKLARKHTFGNVQVLGGHGVGYALHDDPWIPHYGKPGKGQRLFAGQVITVEPMFNLGGDEVEFSEADRWTVTTQDGSLSAQWEETILVTKDGHEILTQIDASQVLPIPKDL